MFALILLSFLFFTPLPAISQTCQNRFATIVNPIRSRQLWRDQSLQPLIDQYQTISTNNQKATWLLQFDTFSDTELVGYIKKFSPDHELGLFLEVSKNLTDKARVIYPPHKYWYDPSVVFLSGYSQSDRKKIITTAFEEFKKMYGYYPKSIGAWYLDSFSLNFIRQKYKIKTVLIVADQKSTDHYGVWGQYWGYPYYPSSKNIQIPSPDNSDIVVIQWALRHPTLAYGDGAGYSNYSLQANDYTALKLSSGHFPDLVSTYLDCRNPLGQITIGLETGMESVGNMDEFSRQLTFISSYQDLSAVTMSEFSDNFKSIYPVNPNSVNIDSWQLAPQYRQNLALSDKVIYNQNYAYPDYFLADQSSFLDRILPTQLSQQSSFYFPFWLIIFILYFIYLNPQVVVISLLSFSGLFFSRKIFGYFVFFGPELKPLIFYQTLFALIFPLLIRKIPKKFFKSIILSFGLDLVFNQFRFTKLEGQYYFGWLFDTFRFFGLRIGDRGISLVNKDFSDWITGAFLKLDFMKYIASPFLIYLFNFIFHLFLGILLFHLLSFMKKTRVIAIPTCWEKQSRLDHHDLRSRDDINPVMILLFILLFLKIISLFHLDPTSVQSLWSKI